MRLSLLICILITGNTSLTAQKLFSQDDQRLFYGGIALGANFSQVDGDSFSGYHKVGIAGGGFVYLRPFQLIGISLGLGFAQKGCNEASLRETMAGPAVFRYRIHLQYAEIPLMVQVFLPGRLHYSAGISYSRLISSKETSEDINPIPISSELYPFEKQEWSVVAGLNYHIYGQWFLSGQYQYSLSSIRNGANIPPGYNTGSGREFNNVMSLRLMYIVGSGNAR